MAKKKEAEMGEKSEAEGEIPASVKKRLTEGTKLLSRAKAIEKEAKEMGEGAKEILLPIVLAYGIGKYIVAGVGTINKRTSKGSVIIESTLSEQLLLAGINGKKIEGILAKSKKSWETDYIEFTFPKDN